MRKMKKVSQMTGTLELIEKSVSNMSKGHKAIATYISDHYDQAVFMTAAKLGETVGVSESTVVRFAYQLQYEGQGRDDFQDLNKLPMMTGG